MRERKFDLCSVLDPMLDRVDQEEALWEPVRLAPERKVDLLAAPEVLSDTKEVVAGCGDDADDRFHPRPCAPPRQFALVLTALRPKNEGLLPTRDMHQKLT